MNNSLAIAVHLADTTPMYGVGTYVICAECGSLFVADIRVPSSAEAPQTISGLHRCLPPNLTMDDARWIGEHSPFAPFELAARRPWPWPAVDIRELA